jgi:hypothetical protein
VCAQGIDDAVEPGIHQLITLGAGLGLTRRGYNVLRDSPSIASCRCGDPGAS